ncbi:hypothetical protein L209DRAFT_62078 [Thermothelomyces heterothallicus CBS 203.75]
MRHLHSYLQRLCAGVPLISSDAARICRPPGGRLQDVRSRTDVSVVGPLIHPDLTREIDDCEIRYPKRTCDSQIRIADTPSLPRRSCTSPAAVRIGRAVIEHDVAVHQRGDAVLRGLQNAGGKGRGNKLQHAEAGDKPWT